MSNQKPAVASDPHQFAILAPSTEGSVYEPSTLAMTCHIVHVQSQACGIRQLHANNAAETVRLSDL
eukprot:135148-Chlamydomonas_euryale.AAC.1